ncbi:hypothetical protein SAMN05216383_11949 [Prevotella sp. KH2C16]|nr:hypothetical protein SAMN05216383_11949 [Prevotella sp. KH2C16]
MIFQNNLCINFLVPIEVLKDCKIYHLCIIDKIS